MHFASSSGENQCDSCLTMKVVYSLFRSFRHCIACSEQTNMEKGRLDCFSMMINCDS